ncbi:hypothetical protein JAAARDRAFT_704052 [Jaapia argillacea MUCL 33604]|uniref:Nephrocystin 3-like N-terminal domain-containing protein n=1 Tax=Jaapia argillacea MUCL 33604 TaxID=933084 RepID=A0A067PNB8_9AGAM|nr:hypothetical protein JAAARDRAFT_704052 [Jaapia argillacea MUCL 33604]
MASNTVITTPTSVQISGITILMDPVVKRKVTMKLLIDGNIFIEQPFGRKLPRLRRDLSPALTLLGGSRLIIQVCKHRTIRGPKVLAEAAFVNQNLQQSWLGTAHQLRDNPNITIDIVAPSVSAVETALSNAVQVTGQRKSVLDHLGRAKTFLETILNIGTAVSELHPVAKAVLASIQVIYKKLQDQEQCDKLILDLANDMAQTLGYIEDVKQFARLVQLKQALDKVDSLMKETTNFVLEYTSHSAEGQLLSSAFSASAADKAIKLTKCFNQFKQQFNTGLAVQANISLEKMLQDLESTQNDEILKILLPKDLDRSIMTEECMANTRQDVFVQIENWANDLSGPNILWIKGFPGAGKSAIASSMVSRLRALHRLGSFFFFRRDQASSQTPSAVWRTVAYDLSRIYPAARNVIVAKLKADEAVVSTANIIELFNELVKLPLLQNSTSIPAGRMPIIVIDALDECGGLESSASTYRRNLLNTIKQWSQLQPCFKLLVTSRMESDISQTFESISYTVASIELFTGRTVSQESASDIHLYLRNSFKAVRELYSYLSTEWPGQETLMSLTDTAAGLFIWAKTIVDLVEQGEPLAQLKLIISGQLARGSIDDLYCLILKTAFPTPALEIQITIKMITGAIVAAKTLLSSYDILQLCSLISPENLAYVCTKLKPIMATGPNYLQFHHQSFVDFLISSEKCPLEYQFQEHIQNQQLCMGCLKVMEQSLHFNMCDLKTSYLCNDDVPGIDLMVDKCIPSDLRYACYFWADHLSLTVFEEEILQALRRLLCEKFLYWLEVLSFTKNIQLSFAALTTLADWVQVSIY